MKTNILPGIQRVAALYVATGGVYFGRDGVDPWDIERDARKYAGPHPVVAHPPCSRWCQLAYMNQARYGHKVGDDGGCFKHALDTVRRVGGVLEHPAFSYAWDAFDLLRPQKDGWSRCLDGGWVAEVSQTAYGHPARKLTWLYYVGDSAPASLDWSRPAATNQVSDLGRNRVVVTAQVSFCGNHGNSRLPRLSKKAASATPPAFAAILIDMARNARRVVAEVAA